MRREDKAFDSIVQQLIQNNATPEEAIARLSGFDDDVFQSYFDRNVNNDYWDYVKEIKANASTGVNNNQYINKNNLDDSLKNKRVNYTDVSSYRTDYNSSEYRERMVKNILSGKLKTHEKGINEAIRSSGLKETKWEGYGGGIGTTDSDHWRRVDRYFDAADETEKYIIHETKVNQNGTRSVTEDGSTVYYKDKDGNFVPISDNSDLNQISAEELSTLSEKDFEATGDKEYFETIKNQNNPHNPPVNTTTQNTTTTQSQSNTSKPNTTTTTSNNTNNSSNTPKKKISQARQDKIEKQRIRRILKDDYKKNAGTGENPKIKEIKRRREQRKNQIKKVNQLDDDVKTLARFEKNRKRAEELKKKAYTDKNLTTQERLDILDEVKRIENEHPKSEEYRRKKQELDRDTTITTKERLKREQELKKEYSYDGLKNRIENADRSVVEEYLEKRQGVVSNNKDYDQFMKDLDLAGRDFVDADGNELNSGFKEFNKKTRKMGLKIKGFITGDYSDYNEYIEAVERLENMGPRNFNRYDIDNLFNSNGNLNSADDVLNLKPTSRTSAKDAFDNWRTGRKNARTRAATKGVPKNTRGVAAAKEAVLRSAPNAKKLFTVQGTFGVGLNLFNAKATYDEERKEGHGVFGSLARAGVDFALGEVLGMKYMGLMAAQAAPRMAVKGVEGLGKLTREKNNMQRHEAFGYASFQDTQQLATMRQSGMEMAKMANYNLQQTLMGNEAKYMHR